LPLVDVYLGQVPSHLCYQCTSLVLVAGLMAVRSYLLLLTHVD
jgi:hypothetical protein